MDTISRRMLLGAGMGAGALLATRASAQNQPAPVPLSTDSTWDRIQSTKVLRLGAAISEPWYFKDTTQSDAPGSVMSGSEMWRGVGTVVGKELADALGVQLEVVETTWGNAVAGLQTEQFDLMFLLDGTPQRALAIDFVPAPLLWYPLVLLARDGIEIGTWSEADDPKYNWGVALGTSNDQFITKTAPKAQISRFQTNGENVAAFQSGRIDGMLATGPYADLNRVRLGMGKTLVPQPPAAMAAGTGLRYEQDPRFKSFLTTSLTYLYNSGRTEELFQQQMAFRNVDPAEVTSVMREKW